MPLHARRALDGNQRHKGVQYEIECASPQRRLGDGCQAEPRIAPGVLPRARACPQALDQQREKEHGRREALVARDRHAQDENAEPERALRIVSENSAYGSQRRQRRGEGVGKPGGHCLGDAPGRRENHAVARRDEQRQIVQPVLV